MKKEQKRISYKLAEGCPGSTHLQGMLGAALKKFKKTGDRRQPIGAAGEHLRFINVYRTHEGVLYGVFHSLSPGSAQLIIEMEGETYTVESVLPTDAGSKNAEFVEGTLFFGVWMNHVLVIQSMACRSEQLENYLTWLIEREMKSDGDGTKSVPLIQLVDPIDPDLKKKDLLGVTGIKLGTSLESQSVVNSSSAASPAAPAKAARFALSSKMLEALATIMGMDSRALHSGARFSDALSSGEVRAVLELTCSKKKADTTAGEVMTALARTFRNLDEPEVEFTLTDGTRIKGSEVKIGKIASVECVDRLPVYESVFAEMSKYFRELIENGRIQETKAFGNVK